MIIHKDTTKAQNGPQITGRGATPANGSSYMSSEGATEWSVTPSGFIYNNPLAGVTPLPVVLTALWAVFLTMVAHT